METFDAFAVQRDIWHLDVTHYEALVLLNFVFHRNNKTGLINPSLATIAKECKCGERVICGSIKNLRNRGFISSRRTGRSCIYELHVENIRLASNAIQSRTICNSESHDMQLEQNSKTDESHDVQLSIAPHATLSRTTCEQTTKELLKNYQDIRTPISLPTFPANSSVAGITDADSKTNVIAFENREEKVIGKKVAGVAASPVIPLTNHQTNLVSTVAADTGYFLAPETIPPKGKAVPVKKVRARRTPVPFSKAGITALPLEWKQKAEMKCSAEGVRISLESLFVDFSTCYQPGGRNERITRVNWIETWLAWVSNAIERQKRRPQVPQEEEVRYSKMGNKYRDSDFRVPDDQQKDWS